MVEQMAKVEKFKRRSDLHLARKLWHILGVSLVAATYSYLPDRVGLGALFLAWAIFVPIDFFRLRSAEWNNRLLVFFRPIMRQNEVDRLAGTTYLLTGLLIIALILPKDIVVLTMMFLALADPIASYFGIRYGKDKIFGHKSLQGSLAAFFVCSLLTFHFLTTRWLLMDHLIVVSLLGGLIGALAELIPVFNLDDNLTLPVLSGVALWALFSVFAVYSPYPYM
jgi:dolichol kinase